MKCSLHDRRIVRIRRNYFSVNREKIDPKSSEIKFPFFRLDRICFDCDFVRVRESTDSPHCILSSDYTHSEETRFSPPMSTHPNSGRPAIDCEGFDLTFSRFLSQESSKWNLHTKNKIIVRIRPRHLRTLSLRAGRATFCFIKNGMLSAQYAMEVHDTYMPRFERLVY